MSKIVQITVSCGPSSHCETRLFIPVEKIATPAPRGSRVYFLACREAGAAKVGWANNVERRIADHQCGCPYQLDLLGTIPGGQRLEAQIHLALTGFGVRGEWFELPAVENFLCDAMRCAKDAIDSRLKRIEENRRRLQKDVADVMRKIGEIRPECLSRRNGCAQLVNAYHSDRQVREVFDNFVSRGMMLRSIAA